MNIAIYFIEVNKYQVTSDSNEVNWCIYEMLIFNNLSRYKANL